LDLRECARESDRERERKRERMRMRGQEIVGEGEEGGRQMCTA